MTEADKISSYICPVCNGKGKYYIDPPDVYEGHKLSRTAVCNFCDGKGSFAPHTKEGKAINAYWSVLYEEKLKEEEAARLKREKQTKLLKSALDKLTAEELEVLKASLKGVISGGSGTGLA